MLTYRATPEQADEVAAVLDEVYQRNPASAEHLAGIIAADDFVLLIATVDGSPAGFLQGEFLDRLDGDTMLLVYEVEVSPRFRRQRVATALMEFALEIARSSGANRCWLVAEPDNTPARGLYESVGGEEWPAGGYRWMLEEE